MEPSHGERTTEDLQSHIHHCITMTVMMMVIMMMVVVMMLVVIMVMIKLVMVAGDDGGVK